VTGEHGGKQLRRRPAAAAREWEAPSGKCQKHDADGRRGRRAGGLGGSAAAGWCWSAAAKATGVAAAFRVGSAAMAFTGMLVRHTCGQWPASCISISLGAWHGDLVSESVSTTIS
jgi:hypothetical protein